MYRTVIRNGRESAWLSKNTYSSRYSQSHVGSVYRSLPPYMHGIRKHRQPVGLSVARVAVNLILILLLLEFQWLVLSKLL
jgi:hypothetical protein